MFVYSFILLLIQYSLSWSSLVYPLTGFDLFALPHEVIFLI
nr:MAG TPA: hypothetical protein [Bacteriophage sp.]